MGMTSDFKIQILIFKNLKKKKMKTNTLFYIPFLTLVISSTSVFSSFDISLENNKAVYVNHMANDSILRHVVLFKFKENTSANELTKIEESFKALATKIPEILDFEWGLNNSPEGLDKGFTHCFLVTFKNEDGRSVYLPHPDHKAFVDLASPYIEDVLVIDYWTPSGSE